MEAGTGDTIRKHHFSLLTTIFQYLQQFGLTAGLFDADEAAQWAFRSAVAATMPGVFPDEVTFNLVISLQIINGTESIVNCGELCAHRRLSDFDQITSSSPTPFPSKTIYLPSIPSDFPAQPTQFPSKQRVGSPIEKNPAYPTPASPSTSTPSPSPLRGYSSNSPSVHMIPSSNPLLEIRNTPSPSRVEITPTQYSQSPMTAENPSFAQSPSTAEKTSNPSSATPSLASFPSGVGINYNVTIGNIQRFGFSDPADCYNSLSNQLVAGINDGSFTKYLKTFSEAYNVTILPDASSEAKDFIFLRQFVYVQTPMETYPPSGFPTEIPTGPTGVPSSFAPSLFPTEANHPKLLYEIVAGITLTGILCSLAYLSSVVTGLLRHKPSHGENVSEFKEQRQQQLSSVVKDRSLFYRLELLKEIRGKDFRADVDSEVLSKTAEAKVEVSHAIPLESSSGVEFEENVENLSHIIHFVSSDSNRLVRGEGLFEI